MTLVERGTSLVVANRERREVRLRRPLALFPPGEDPLDGFGGLVAGRLDEIRLQPRLFAHVRVRPVVKFLFGGRYLLHLPCVADDVVGRL